MIKRYAWYGHTTADDESGEWCRWEDARVLEDRCQRLIEQDRRHGEESHALLLEERERHKAALLAMERRAGGGK